MQPESLTQTKMFLKKLWPNENRNRRLEPPAGQGILVDGRAIEWLQPIFVPQLQTVLP
jgi:hypothetical protein